MRPLNPMDLRDRLGIVHTPYIADRDDFIQCNL
jgi:hypothetical protein